MSKINIKCHINGGLAGSKDYTFDDEPDTPRKPLIRRHGRTGKIELYGQASNAEWAQLIEGMIEDSFSVKGPDPDLWPSASVPQRALR